MSRISFSLKYAEKRFKHAMKDNNLEIAHTILVKSPPSHTPSEELQRLIFLVQGYKQLIDAYKNSFQTTLHEYFSLGTPNRVRIQQKLLDEYKKFGSLEEIKSKISDLNALTHSSRKL